MRRTIKNKKTRKIFLIFWKLRFSNENMKYLLYFLNYNTFNKL